MCFERKCPLYETKLTYKIYFFPPLILVNIDMLRNHGAIALGYLIFEINKRNYGKDD
jgi:hypothetical protein